MVFSVASSRLRISLINRQSNPISNPLGYYCIQDEVYFLLFCCDSFAMRFHCKCYLIYFAFCLAKYYIYFAVKVQGRRKVSNMSTSLSSRWMWMYCSEWQFVGSAPYSSSTFRLSTMPSAQLSTHYLHYAQHSVHCWTT